MPLTITKTVRPNAVWQEMHLQISKNQRVIIAADGLWSPELRPATIVWCGADGVYKHAAGEGYLLPGTNVGALIGRIGSGAAFTIGSRFDRFINQQGVLYLAMNENPKYNNQAGKLTAQVILFGDYAP